LVIRWGFQNKKQRFKCKACGQLFTWRNEGKRYGQLFVWFEFWILQKHTLVQLERESGYSKRTLQNIFYHFLDKPPVFQIPQKENVHLLIDGTYFSKKICLVVYRNNDVKITQLYRLTDDEVYEEIKEDLENLKTLGINIVSITCDGHASILKAIRKVFRKDVLIQRCLVHIQRMARNLITQNPKSIAGIELRLIVNQLHKIITTNDKLYWLQSFHEWNLKHHSFLQEKTIPPNSTEERYKHIMIRRARYLILRALPNMFHFIDDSLVPKSTNALESFFGHLKDNLSIHRGLTKEHRKNFIRWYLFFKNKK
jgi:hypothetical protein